MGTHFVTILLLTLFVIYPQIQASELRLSTFEADVTPPLGSPLCFNFIKPAATVETPLTARGIILFSEDKPIVLCVADFVVIANDSHDAWKEALAEAAGTTPDRVAMHVIHNHDSPGYDISASTELEKVGLKDVMSLREAHNQAIADTADAVREAVAHSAPVTHMGTGTGIVEKFASNRRIIGENGKLVMARMSSCRNEAIIAQPEGTIDPELNLISFWNEDTALAALTFYASHPQSYYGRGGITPDTVGLARNQRSEETGTLHIHFDGAGGNVAAGKYNDGSPEARARLVDRVHAGMKEAWEHQITSDLTDAEPGWKTIPTQLPWNSPHSVEELTSQLSNPDSDTKTRIRAARDLVYHRRWKEGGKIEIHCLRLGRSRVLFFPGELFVEYQLSAKAMRPDDFVAVAAYGDGGPGYIGTEVSYGQGGYEVGRVSRTAPAVEAVLKGVIEDLLGAK
ncbi:MAG: hypothetical protein P1U87_02095 [Verrucomicrobiales bacterium]|nr:hypothetical protein [Verrucomicrobiales bacterium]